MNREQMFRLTRRATLGASCFITLAVPSVLAPGLAYAAPSPPITHTGEAGYLTSSSTTLYGSVDPNNQETHYYFEYGTTAAYGAQAPLSTAGGGIQTLSVKAMIVGLLPNTLYHYRLVAGNATGQAEGLDRTFTTKKVPLKFTISASPRLVVFGGTVAVSGTLTGTESADRALTLLYNPFPFLSNFKPFGSEQLTKADGSFSLPVDGLSQNTQFRVATLENHPVESGVVTERVAVRVTLHASAGAQPGFVRLYGTVAPAQALAIVRFQLLRPGRSPLTIARSVLTGRPARISRFSQAVRIRRSGLYRAYVQVATGAQVSHYSRAIQIGK
jgi:hypothetical protein